MHFADNSSADIGGSDNWSVDSKLVGFGVDNNLDSDNRVADIVGNYFVDCLGYCIALEVVGKNNYRKCSSWVHCRY